METSCWCPFYWYCMTSKLYICMSLLQNSSIYHHNITNINKHSLDYIIKHYFIFKLCALLIGRLELLIQQQFEHVIRNC